MITGLLRATGLGVQRWRVRDAIGRVDPLGPVVRGPSRRMQRSSSSVPCPNALWEVKQHTPGKPLMNFFSFFLYRECDSH